MENTHLRVVVCALAAEGSGFCEADQELGFVEVSAAGPILLLRAEGQHLLEVGRCVVVAEGVPGHARRSQERCEERVRTHHRGSRQLAPRLCEIKRASACFVPV